MSESESIEPQKNVDEPQDAQHQNARGQPDESRIDAMLRVDAAESTGPHAATSVTADPPIARVPMAGPPKGLRRADQDGLEMIDAMAGRAASLGFGFQRHIDAIQAAAETYLGDAASLDDSPSQNHGRPIDGEPRLLTLFRQVLGDSSAIEIESAILCSWADVAVERAIEIARIRDNGTRFRTIALGGSDHGRTGVCRTASGKSDLHEGYGPMMAGFGHVPAGDIDSLSNAIDEQCAAVLLSPVQQNNACQPLEASYLQDVRRLCDEHDLLLMMDESRLCFGSTPQPFAFASIADISADVVICAGGLFAGLPGAIVLANGRATRPAFVDLDRFPLLAAVAIETLIEMQQRDLPHSAAGEMQDFAVAVAERIGSFEFVRDLHATGMNIGIETDIPADELVRTALRCGLMVESSGDTSIRMQPPIQLDSVDREALLDRLAAMMEVIEQRGADVDLAAASQEERR